MKKASIFIMILSVLSKLLGFVREAVLAALVGAGDVSDAFVYAFSLPTTFFSMVIAAFATGLIPMFTRVENEEGKPRAMLFLNNTLNTMVIIGLIVTMILFLFTEQSLSILLPSAESELLVYLVPFLKITSFSISFTAIIQILTGFLHVRGSFLTVAVLGFPLNIIVIVFIYLSQNFGVNILPWGILLAYTIQAVLILAYSYAKGFRYKATFNFRDPHTSKMVVLAIPLIVGSATTSIGNLVMNSMATSVSGSGGMTYINYALRIGGLVEGIFGLAIITVMYPSLSRAISLGKYETAKREFGDSLISELLLIVPSMIGLLLLAQPIIQLIFMRGKFTMENVLVLTPVLVYFALGLAFYSVHNLIVRVFYSYQDMKTPMVVSIVIIVLQIVLGYVFSAVAGLGGITLGMAVAYIIGVIIEFKLIMKKFGSFPVLKYRKQAIKILIASGVMALVILVCRFALEPHLGNTTFLLVTILISVIVYLSMIFFLKVEIFTELFGAVMNKVKRRER